MEWSGLDWSGVEWSGVDWIGVEWSGVEWSGEVFKVCGGVVCFQFLWDRIWYRGLEVSQPSTASSQTFLRFHRTYLAHSCCCCCCSSCCCCCCCCCCSCCAYHSRRCGCCCCRSSNCCSRRLPAVTHGISDASWCEEALLSLLVWGHPLGMSVRACVGSIQSRHNHTDTLTSTLEARDQKKADPSAP